MAGLTNLVSEELLEWFACDIDEGDAPELHLVGFATASSYGASAFCSNTRRNGRDRTFHIDAESMEATETERPDVAELVASRRASHACIGADGMSVDGVTLPLVEMFLFVDEIEFFWWPSPHWTRERVVAFFALLLRLLDVTGRGALRPDPRYPATARRRLADAMSRLIGDSRPIDLDGRRPGDS